MVKKILVQPYWFNLVYLRLSNFGIWGGDFTLGLPGGSDGKESAKEGNGNQIQCSCLENSKSENRVQMLLLPLIV